MALLWRQPQSTLLDPKDSRDAEFHKVKRPQVVGAAQEKHGPLLVLKELTVCGCWAPPDSQ